MNITAGPGGEGGGGRRRVTHDKSASKPTTRQDIIGHRYSHSRGTQTNSNITICVITITITITNHHYDVITQDLTRLNQ